MRPRPATSAQRYEQQWARLHGRVVDEPKDSVDEAAWLVDQVMTERGYPAAGFDERAALLSVEGANVVGDYREASELRRSAEQAGPASTEQLRNALLRYRSLCEYLLFPEPSDTAYPSEPQRAGGKHQRVGRES